MGDEPGPAAQPPDPVPPDPDPPNSMEVSTASCSKRPLVGASPEYNPPTKKIITSPEAAVASIQTIYTHPSVVVGSIQSYTNNDKGPYVVHVSRSETDEASVGAPIKSIKFGQFLTTNKFTNICPDGVKRVGRSKISVEFQSAQAANSFIISPILNLCKYVATIPTYNVTRMGLVRQVPTDLSMNDFANDAMLPSTCGIIIKARRLNRKVVEEGKVSWVPTQSVVVTFQGQTLP